MKFKTLARRNLEAVHISGYEVVRVPGKGSFGVVRLVRERSESSLSNSQGVCEPAKALDGHGDVHDRHKRTFSRNRKQVHAMKAIRKSDMLRNSQ
jgi:protein-serine/threonine kinase